MWRVGVLLFWGCCVFRSWEKTTVEPNGDVNECADTTTCPAYATCTNTAGSYYCACKRGFLSSNGQLQFRGPGVECNDLDECTESPPRCGPHSVCKNLPGRYKCSCLPGFSSPTGDWVPGNPGNFSCSDIDECLSSGVCPEHSACANSVGSYSCSCQVGFVSNGSTCEDVDECLDMCPFNSNCINTPGSYFCTCHPGFAPNFRGQGMECVDVDECSRDLPPCGPNSVCTNTLSSYSCRCTPGFRPHPEDVNECADTTTCPAYATCTNTVGSHYCACKRGFLSSNGQLQFRGPGVECNDLDECTESPPRCGPHSVCKNLPGRYKCSCLPGFSSPTGDWVPGNPGNFSCSDIDECLSSGVCPEHSSCANSVGSYSCSCQDGFVSNGSTCEDVDECLDMCPFNSNCINTPGSYFCTCHPGFAPNFRGQGMECVDVDECSRDLLPCGPNAVCTNTLGSYSCRCTPGFRPHPEGSQGHGNFSCKRILFKCKEDLIPHNKQVQQCHVRAPGGLEYLPFCALMNDTFRLLDKTCDNKTTAVSLQSAAESVTSVLEQKSGWTNLAREETSVLGTVLLESVRSTTLAALLRSSENASQTVQTEHLEIESKVIKEECLEGNASFHLKAKGDAMRISCSVIEESGSTGSTGVAFVSFANMESVLDERFFQDPQSPWANSKQRLKMNSRIIGGIMTGEKKEDLSDPVIYVLENLQPMQKSERPICVSWSTDVGDGGWTPSGCEVLRAAETHTYCSCKRLANLAIIMAFGELTMEFSLSIINHVGLIISLVCLVLAIATFLLCRTIRSRNTFLHLHLCVCLFLAKILFLTGIDKTDNKVVCAVIAGCLHYLFLACFSWMLVEAVMLFLMVRNLKVVNYFSSHNVRILHLCAFGYGLPGVVVAVSASMHPWGYGTHRHCWLSTERGAIWSFLGPVCVVILINSILLTWTLCILRQKLSSVNADVSTLKDTRLLTFKAFAQFFILGCPWVLGLFQIGRMATIMAYLFTIINSLQGTLIFIIHCLLSRQVREEYRRCLTRKTKPSSQSQTSGILLSSLPSSSKTG